MYVYERQDSLLYTNFLRRNSQVALYEIPRLLAICETLARISIEILRASVRLIALLLKPTFLHNNRNKGHRTSAESRIRQSREHCFIFKAGLQLHRERETGIIDVKYGVLYEDRDILIHLTCLLLCIIYSTTHVQLDMLTDRAKQRN